VTRVGIKGIDKVKRTSEEEKSKRKKYTALDVDEHAHCGEDRPLLILFENREALPPILLINNDNAEYPIYEQTKLYQPLLHNRKLTNWTSELDAIVALFEPFARPSLLRRIRSYNILYNML
jgi:hypothetical protein